MSIEKFTTSGLIVSAYDVGESDTVFKIYTKDLGLIIARQSSLKKSVKLRAHLMLHRFTSVTVVKGKEHYRIVGAREIEDKNNKAKNERGCMRAAHLGQLIVRFVGYEVKSAKIFDKLESYIYSYDQDMSIIKIAFMCDLLIVGGYLDSRVINMTLEEYKASSAEDVSMRVILGKEEIVKNLRVAVEASML